VAVLGRYNHVGPEVLKLFKKIKRRRALCGDVEEKFEGYIQEENENSKARGAALDKYNAVTNGGFAARVPGDRSPGGGGMWYTIPIFRFLLGQMREEFGLNDYEFRFWVTSIPAKGPNRSDCSSLFIRQQLNRELVPEHAAAFDRHCRPPYKTGWPSGSRRRIRAHSASNPHPESQSEASCQPARFRPHCRRFMHRSHTSVSRAAMWHCPKTIDAAAFPCIIKGRPAFKHPPGLQKKLAKGKPLPPGWQKKLQLLLPDVEGGWAPLQLLRAGRDRRLRRDQRQEDRGHFGHGAANWRYIALSVCD
jgi:hypothetical protein